MMKNSRSNRKGAQPEAMKALCRCVVSVLLCAVLLVSALDLLDVKETLSWYRTNKEIGMENGGIDSATSSERVLEAGHDTFMYDIENDKGILADDTGTAVVTMNEYDTIFSDRNTYTPIILRAVLSSDYASMAAKGEPVTLRLTSTCIDTLKKAGYTDVFARYDKNAENAIEGYAYEDISSYLSNVLNVRVGYVPGLVVNAETGNFDGTVYKDADDYVYNEAVKALSGNPQFEFAEQKSYTPPSSEEKVTYTATEITTIKGLNDAITKASNNTNARTEYYYFIKDANGNYLAPSGLGAVTGLDLSKEAAKTSSWALAKSGTSYVFSAQKNSTTYYLRGTGNSYTLEIDTSNSKNTWAAADVTGGIRMALNSNRYLYLNGSNWSTNRNYSTAVTIVQVEKKTETITIPATYTYDNNVNITVDLRDAAEDNGNYYVYIMLDYDRDLVKSYYNYNGMMFELGKNLEEFEDIFHIEPITNS